MKLSNHTCNTSFVFICFLLEWHLKHQCCYGDNEQRKGDNSDPKVYFVIEPTTLSSFSLWSSPKICRYNVLNNSNREEGGKGTYLLYDKKATHSISKSCPTIKIWVAICFGEFLILQHNICINHIKSHSIVTCTFSTVIYYNV